MVGIESIGSDPSRELANLRRRRIGLFRLIAFSLVTLVALYLLSASLTRGALERARFEVSQRELVATGFPWTRDLLGQQEWYRSWLSSHGTFLEVNAFDRVSELLFSSAAFLAGQQSEHSYFSFLTDLGVALHFGALRILFIVLASLRLWLSAVIVAFAMGVYAVRLHLGRDLLGLTGNGRLFFSGSRAGLDVTNARGAPELHVRGLACPPKAPLSVAKAVHLGQLLERYGAANETNYELVAVIVGNETIPAYVAPSHETEALTNAFAGASLLQNADAILHRALQLHAHFRKGHHTDESLTFLNSGPVRPQNGQFSSTEYADLLQRAFARVLTPKMRADVGSLTPAQIATTVLAYEAGKVLAYAKEGGRWIKKSHFGQLSARAVLHSMAGYGIDYSFDERTIVRRALVFGSRQSVYAPVRFPVDLDNTTRALRQWVELLMAGPHTLQSVADEVELFGLIAEAHDGWLQKFVTERGSSIDKSLLQGCYCTPGNLIFLPMTALVKIMKEVVEPAAFHRMEELVFLVSQQQRLELMAREIAGDQNERTHLASYERIFPPLTHAEIKEISEQQGIATQELREWSTFRVVLNAFGWLGRRVGDYAVPESSVIFAIFRVPVGMVGANTHGRLGAPGMVALRATHLQERQGRQWRERFIAVLHSTMAETKSEYEQRLQGVDPLPTLSEGSDTSTVVGGN